MIAWCAEWNVSLKQNWFFCFFLTIVNLPSIYELPIQFWPLLGGLGPWIKPGIPPHPFHQDQRLFLLHEATVFISWLAYAHLRQDVNCPFMKLKTGLLASQTAMWQGCGKRNWVFLGFFYFFVIEVKLTAGFSFAVHVSFLFPHMYSCNFPRSILNHRII